MTEKRASLRFWLITAVSLGLLLGGIGFTAARFVVKSELDYFAARFLLLNSLRKEALESYFDTVRAEITFWSLNQDLLSKQADLGSQWKAYQDAGRGADARLDYNSFTGASQAELNALARLFVTERGYYDFFLIGAQGDVLYTVAKEADLETNLISGPWRDTGLAEVYRGAVQAAEAPEVVFSDFVSYAPSAGEPAMFAAIAMRDADEQVLGVLALQLPTDRIRAIMQFTAGMGETGETYLVGEDLLMRSDSRFSEDSTILRTRVDTEPVRRALGGETGTLFAADYRGENVLSAYTATQIGEFRWAVMAEIDEQEVLQTMAGKRPAIAGLVLALYALAMWSVWYIRAGKWSGDRALADLGHIVARISRATEVSPP
jgi:hypothetical protein